VTKYSLLQILPSEFRLYDAIQHLPAGTRELVLKPGNDPRRVLLRGATVYLWESEGRDLIGKGTVLTDIQTRPQPEWQHQFEASGKPEPADGRVIIRVDLRLDQPISRERIRQDPTLAKATFFKNATNVQGSVFKVEPETAQALDGLIDVERRRIAGLSEEVPDGYLDVLAEADLNGDFDPNAGEDARKRQWREIALRQGQPQFRGQLLEAYDGCCAITNCDVTEALEAAHILPAVNEQRNHITNGLLLRADMHTLFDLYLIAVGEDLEIMVASSLRNTKFGAEISRRKLRTPNSSSATPSSEALRQHRSRFKT
jgi:hypothetical protein